jgi:replicative superfamily II helicase
LIFNNSSKIEILDVNGDVQNNFVMQSVVESLENKYPNNIKLMQEDGVKKEFLASKDIMIISLESWKSLVDSQSDWLSGIPSVLILKP